jgi:hypothetical protein
LIFIWHWRLTIGARVFDVYFKCRISLILG